MPFRSKIQSFLKSLADIAIIVAISLAIFEYYNNLSLQRVELADQKVEAMLSSPVFDARMRLFRFYRSFDFLDASEIGMDRNTLNRMIHAFVDANKHTYGDDFFWQDIITIVERVENAINCIEVGACDQRIVSDFILNPFADFYCFFRYEISEIGVATSQPDFGRRLEAYYAVHGECG